VNAVAENVELTIVCWITEDKEYFEFFDNYIQTPG